ncbi:hypothetical protein FEDK69T_23550 [Flavobacterium enshiense DK69]|uniref:Transporter n=1 Tax=Flavobacterium enshiense DK69 TaxID=1107311 RepID=V6SD82_9FLAO|nr:hypothetical protein [Flavobacterium enshiense]ESU22370.1 hypothetical protein FEDK69T_23550 [Flavobacterium enshiense DK69]KGO97369.1 hypothetical protein Q767_01880 [Flavobacterium enshiense DK69]
MKKYLLNTVLFLSALIANAQEPTPLTALRYAMDNTQGSARFRGMSGAFGAVGGDLSSINVNPAGSALLNSNTSSLTMSVYNNSNKSNYYGGMAKDNTTTFNFNEMGAAFVFYNTKPNADWKRFTFAINYETTNDFDNDIYTQGVNPNRSIDEYFTSFANGFGGLGGIKLGVLDDGSYENYTSLPFADQQAWLGYWSFMFDPVTPDPNNTVYTSNVPRNTSYYQTNMVNSSGYNGKLSFNFATDYKDILYLGLNLNSHFTNYFQYSSLYESNSGPNNLTGNTLHSVVFNNHMHTYGSGFSLSVGAIAKLSKEFRVGFAYESPTWYNLTDELSQDISSRYSDPNNLASSASKYPPVINIYPSYKLNTPQKFNVSGTFLFGKKGLISVDYTYKDYSTTKYKPENEIFYSSVNSLMNSSLRAASEVRAGFEHRMKQVSLRGGYRFEQSPYDNGKTIGDLHGFSTGIGYDFGFSRLDFAYAYSQRDMQVYLLSSFTDAATVTTKTNNFFLTYTFNF